MTLKYFTKLNIVFAIQLTLVVLAVLNILPREIFLFSAGVLIFFVLFEPIEESVFLIARSIPIFVALPITENFDSLNVWRLVVLALFLKWFFVTQFKVFFENLKEAAGKIGEPANLIKLLWNKWRIEFLAAFLFIISALSLFKAEDLGIGVKRIIFFVNLGMLFFIVRSAVSRVNLRRLAVNVLVSGIIVVIVGMLQLMTAYLIYIDNFAEWWALQFNKTLYGSAWANIAINANTWFAYYYDTIHLRVFASFPDTHSFPIYLLMVICFAMTLLSPEIRKNWKYALYFFVALAVGELILSGTRGIWASAVFPIIFLLYIFWKKITPKIALSSAALPFVLFAALLPFTYPIFSSTQFKLKESAHKQDVLKERIKSIIDMGETSNNGRIFIWKETLKSAVREPLLGVGIGNFPTILKLNPTAIKAGASAHNLYLNVLAEMGAIGFIGFALLVGEIFKKAWGVFMSREQPAIVWFFGLNAIVYLIWIFWYSMTDVAIFDERAFLMLMILLGSLFALAPEKKK